MSVASRESWDEYRRKMLAETERFINWGLTHPDEVIEVPTKHVSEGGFPKKVGEWFWSTVLSDKATGKLKQWRSLLRRRPRLSRRKVDLRSRRMGRN